MDLIEIQGEKVFLTQDSSKFPFLKENVKKNLTNYIFTTSTGRFYYRRTLQQFFERLYRRIGVPYHKIHDFRHTFGTNLSRAEVPLRKHQS